MLTETDRRFTTQAAAAAVEKQPLHFIRLPLCRVPADRFGRLERGFWRHIVLRGTDLVQSRQRQFAPTSPPLPLHKTSFH